MANFQALSLETLEPFDSEEIVGDIEQPVPLKFQPLSLDTMQSLTPEKPPDIDLPESVPEPQPELPQDQFEKPSFMKDVLGKTVTDLGEEFKGMGEAAMSVASGMLLWPPSKVYGIMALPFGREAADMAEAEIQSLAYSPYTEKGKAAMELVGKGFEYYLKPAIMAGEATAKQLPEHVDIGTVRVPIPREEIAYLVQLGGELVEFALTGALGKAGKAKLKKTRPWEKPVTEAEPLDTTFADAEIQAKLDQLRERPYEGTPEIIDVKPTKEATVFPDTEAQLRKATKKVGGEPGISEVRYLRDLEDVTPREFGEKLERKPPAPPPTTKVAPEGAVGEVKTFESWSAVPDFKGKPALDRTIKAEPAAEGRWWHVTHRTNAEAILHSNTFDSPFFPESKLKQGWPEKTVWVSTNADSAKSMYVAVRRMQSFKTDGEVVAWAKEMGVPQRMIDAAIVSRNSIKGVFESGTQKSKSPEKLYLTLQAKMTPKYIPDREFLWNDFAEKFINRPAPVIISGKLKGGHEGVQAEIATKVGLNVTEAGLHLVPGKSREGRGGTEPAMWMRGQDDIFGMRLVLSESSGENILPLSGKRVTSKLEKPTPKIPEKPPVKPTAADKQPWEMTKVELRNTENRKLEKLVWKPQADRIRSQAKSTDPQVIADFYSSKFKLPKIKVVDDLHASGIKDRTGTVGDVAIPKDKSQPIEIALTDLVRGDEKIILLRHEIEHIKDYVSGFVSKAGTPVVGIAADGTIKFREGHHKYYANFSTDYPHRALVKQALADKKPVPAEVLAEYPDLAKPIKPKVSTKEPKKVEGRKVSDIAKDILAVRPKLGTLGEKGMAGDFGGLTRQQQAAVKRLNEDLLTFRKNAKDAGKSLEQYLADIKIDPKLAAALADMAEKAKVVVKEPEKKLVTKEVVAEVEAMFEEADKAAKVAHKKSKIKTYHALKRALVDVSGNLKTAALKLGEEGKQVVMHHDLIAGAGSKATKDFIARRDEMLKGLSKDEVEIVNRIIQPRRTIAIEAYKDIRQPRDISGEKLQIYLDSLPKDSFEKLNKRADIFFETMHEQLDILLKEEIITKESYDALSKAGDYSPRRYLQHIDPDATYTFAGEKITVSDSGLKPLAEGSYGLLEKDASLLMAQVIARTQGRVFRNRANKALYELAKAVPENGIVEISEVVKTTKDGKPIYQKAPAGYSKVSVVIEGKTREMILPNAMAREWVMRDPAIDSQFANILGWISGAKILRPMATGLNPEFAVTNLPRDIAHIWLTTEEYSPTIPKAAVQFGIDLAKVLPDAIKRTGRWNDYLDGGGGMEFLTHQGKPVKTPGKIVDKIQTAMGWFGETSEIVTRLAVRERSLKNGKSPTEATWIARNYLDFSQGGSWAKATDTVVPYLNASIQGTRGIFRAAARNPKLFTYKVAQVGTLATALYLSNKNMNPECLDQISEREKINNWIITTPFTFTDKDGNVKYFYFKVAKDQGQRVFATIFENLMGKYLGEEINVEQIAQAAQDAIPIMPTTLLPPTMDAIMGYAANKDFWRWEDVWKGPKIKPEEEYTRYTHPAFVKAGEITGMSPKRTQYALSQLFTQGNIYTSLVGYAWKQIFDELSEKDKNLVTEEIILNKPFIRRIINETDPYNKSGKSLREIELETTTERYKLSREFDTISQAFYDGEKSRKEVNEFINQVPLVDRKRLRNRHTRRGKLQKVPEKRWWLELASLSSPEAKATIYWTRWLSADKEQKDTLDKWLMKLPGIRSERFWARFGQLKRKQKQEKP